MELALGVREGWVICLAAEPELPVLLPLGTRTPFPFSFPGGVNSLINPIKVKSGMTEIVDSSHTVDRSLKTPNT
jgi:hypothetical protein